MPELSNFCTTLMTRVLRISGQFYLKVKPLINTRAPSIWMARFCIAFISWLAT